MILWHLVQPFLDEILQLPTLHEGELEGVNGLPCATHMLVAVRQRLVAFVTHLHEHLELR